MTTLYRILVILVVAFMIGGVMYAAAGGSGSSTSALQTEGVPQGERVRPEGHDEGGEGGGLPIGWIKSLVLMAVGAGVFLGLGQVAILVKPKTAHS